MPLARHHTQQITVEHHKENNDAIAVSYRGSPGLRRFYLLRLGTGSALGGIQALALLAGLVLFGASAWWLMRDYDPRRDDVVVRNPSIAHFLFDSTRSAPLWLGARVYLGY